MNCNPDAFNWIISILKIQSSYEDLIEQAQKDTSSSRDFNAIKKKYLDQCQHEEAEHMRHITTYNCLNVIVTCFFLKTTWIYEKLWNEFFQYNFSEVVNNCKISLTNINQGIIKDMATRVSEQSLENLNERKDKLISKLYQERTEIRILGKNEGEAKAAATQDEQFASEQDRSLYWCDVCKRLLTEQQAQNISCTEMSRETLQSFRSTSTAQSEDAALRQLKCFKTDGRIYIYHAI